MSTLPIRPALLGFLLFAVFAAPFAPGQDAPKKSDTPDKKRQPKFTIGKETTYVLKPVDKDGYIDYLAALNERLKEGVTPEKNAVVLLMKALGPKPEGARLPPAFYRWLEMEEPPEKGDYFQAVETILSKEFKRDGEKFYDDWIRVSERPWTAKQFPLFAAGLQANEKQLAIVVEATKRERYFHPLVTTQPNELLVAALVPTVAKCRHLAHVLTARAMLRIGEKQYDAAWQDLLACHRLGRHVACGATMIEGLAGIAMDQIASNADVAFLDTAPYDAKRWKACLRDLQALPPITGLPEKVDFAERFLMLDIIMNLARNGPGLLDTLSGKMEVVPGKTPKQKTPNPWENADWDPVLRKANGWYDRISSAMREKERGKREREFEQINADSLVLVKATRSQKAMIELIFAKQKPDQAVQRVGDILIAMLMPAVQKVQHSHDRIEQVQRNLHLAFALAAYKADHGKYPLKLDALAPKYLPQVPLDLFTGKALIYRPSENGYLLYSFGPNGQDDEGRWYEDDPPGDDPRVRLPLPKAKMKE